MKRLLPIFFIVLSVHCASGQTFLNGDFESTTGSCSFNLPNVTFNGMMSDCNAFGAADQCDIINSSCSFGTAHSGSFFIGLAVDITDTNADAVALKLDVPLVTGKLYVIRFFNKKDAGYNTNLLEVGYSTDSSSFGTAIDTAALPGTTWTLVSMAFVPTAPALFITVRTIPGAYGWNHVDNFSISDLTGVNEQSHIASKIKLYPNPASSFINVELDEEQPIQSIILYSSDGRVVNSINNLHSTLYNLNLEGLSAGIYFLDCQTANGSERVRMVKY